MLSFKKCLYMHLWPKCTVAKINDGGVYLVMVVITIYFVLSGVDEIGTGVLNYSSSTNV